MGLRDPHMALFLKDRPAVDWLEVHSENFFNMQGLAFAILEELRRDYPISIHGVGLSLGSAEGLDKRHLRALKRLIEAIEPCFISEHLSWSRVEGIYMPDLLPLPYCEESFSCFKQNLAQAQDFLGRALWIENPSSYLQYELSDRTEPDFMQALAGELGTKILLDINNVFVSSFNHGWNPYHYLRDWDPALIGEYHLAGHSLEEVSPGQFFRIDTHDREVCAEVWDLYDYALDVIGPRPTLMEWDTQIPALSLLIQERDKARQHLYDHSKKACLEGFF